MKQVFKAHVDRAAPFERPTYTSEIRQAAVREDYFSYYLPDEEWERLARLSVRPKNHKTRIEGLGDLIAAITKLFGVKPCRKCNKRRRCLNRLVRFRRK